MDTHVSARLLEYRRGHFVAFGPAATVGLLPRPRVVAVPGMPFYSRGLVAWEGHQLPLLDLDGLLRAHPVYNTHNAQEAAHVLVLAYQRAPGEPLEYGAVCAPWLISMVQVADHQQCALPGDSGQWQRIALSCFEHAGHCVPVIDVARLFREPLFVPAMCTMAG